MMIAIYGFDDRESINHALKDRYILSYEPFEFKGDLNDFPSTLAYGKKVDAFRKRYREYLWDAEFRDTLEAEVTMDGKPFEDYSVFRTSKGKHAVVVVNDDLHPIHVSVKMDGEQKYVEAAPETPQVKPSNGSVTVEARSTAVLMQE